MNKKLYFSRNDTVCNQIDAHKDYMTFNDIDEMEIILAKRETNTGYFYCKKFDDIGEVGEMCGKICDGYIPNNGKSGRCKHYGYCYEKTDNIFCLTLKNGIFKLRKLK